MGDEKTDEQIKASTQATVEYTAAKERDIEATQRSTAAAKEETTALDLLNKAKQIGVNFILNQTQLEASRIRAEKDVIAAKNELSNSLKKNTDAFIMVAGSTLGASKAISEYGSQLQDSVKNSSNLAASINSITDAIGKIPLASDAMEGLRTMAAKVGIKPELIQTYLNGADAVQNMKEAMLASAAASGNASEAFDVLINQGVQKSGAYITSLYDGFKNISDATGVSTESIAKMHNAIKALSPALVDGKNVANVFGTETDINGQRIDFTTAALKIAEGSFSSYSQVVSDAADAINNYNASGPAALAFTSKMAEMTTRLGVPISDAREYMKGFSGEMKFVGDNMEGSAEAFARLYDGFRQTGVSSKAATEMVKDFTGQINKLEIQQKAFLSAQTGGPGGLRGGFEIEKMLQEGKYVEVFEKVKKTMQKMLGGNLVSLDEATKSEAAASQYQKQIMMLRSGPLGNFAKTDAEARKMLEGFSKGFGADMLKSKAEASQEAIDRGEKLQALKITPLTSVMSNLESIKVKNEIQASTLIIDRFSLAGNSDISDKLKLSVGESKEKAYNRMTTHETMRDMSLSAETNHLNDEGKLSVSGVGHIKEEMINSITDSVELVTSSIGTLASDLVKSGAGMIKEIAASTTKFASAQIEKNALELGISLLKEGKKIDTKWLGNEIKKGSPEKTADAVIQSNKEKQEEQQQAQKTQTPTEGQSRPQEITVKTICEKCVRQIAHHVHTDVGGTIPGKKQ